MILGLDVSTSCIGWCVIEPNATFNQMGYIELSKVPGIFKKANVALSELREIHEKFQVSSVYIEENLQAFRPGFSSAKTLITLSRFNGIISYLCEKIFETEPEFINVNAARKAVGLSIVRKSKGGTPTKHQVLDWVTMQLKGSGYSWPVKILKSGPRKGTSVFQNGCYDMADAFVIVRAGITMNEQLD